MTSEQIQPAIDLIRKLDDFASPLLERLSEYGTIEFTGDGPSDAEPLNDFVQPRRQTGGRQLLVVGWFGADQEIMNRWVQKYRREKVDFMPQECLFDFLLFGHNWWQDYTVWLNDCLQNPCAEGLQALKETFEAHNFEWPSIEAEESTGATETDIDYQEVSELKELGYAIWKDGSRMSQVERRQALVGRCIPRLGVQPVVLHIAGLIRQRRRQKGGAQEFANAIDSWTADLEWIHSTYKHNFEWPNDI